ncbi:hypothetical protein J6590_001987 [Homalodisca vitripennis]|nr:hypothetical protein J6590_001987 [Homalodisca vitripennis]
MFHNKTLVCVSHELFGKVKPLGDVRGNGGGDTGGGSEGWEGGEVIYSTSKTEQSELIRSVGGQKSLNTPPCSPQHISSNKNRPSIIVDDTLHVLSQN